MSRLTRVGLAAAALFLAAQIVGYLLLAIFTATANDKGKP